MLFSKVTLENIKTAVNEFNQKGTPAGFSTSKYYDVKIDGTLYPPKPIMAIANYYATDRKIENYFSGGENTPCFKAYKRLGIEIVTKSNNMLEKLKYQYYSLPIYLLVRLSKEKDFSVDNIDKIVVGLQNFRNSEKGTITQNLYQKAFDWGSEDKHKAIHLYRLMLNGDENAFNQLRVSEILEFSKLKDISLEELEMKINKKSKNETNAISLKELFFIQVSNDIKDEDGDSLNARLEIVENGYLLLKGSYVYKKPKPSFLKHSYFDLISSYATSEYVNETSFGEFYLLKKDILFNSPSAAAAMVLNRAANGRKEWKLEEGTTLEKFENKFDFSNFILDFLEQTKTESLKTKDYPKSYDGHLIRVSFGTGNQAKIPWIALLKEPNKVTDGIYPVYLYFKNIKKLILAYGLSETNNPKVKWNLNNPISITNYFYKNGLGKPDRYGSSYVYKAYDVDDFPNEEIINKDLDNLLAIYKNQENPIDVSPEIVDLVEQEDFKLSQFIEDTKASGLLFTNTLLTRFVSSLITKPFVLLSGLSGSGKTKLAQTFAKWVCEDDNQYCVVPVGADWTNREPLLGYENALNNKEYILPENGALQLVINANQNASKPHFLILDEMNLSHVERYFADFLSVMESKEKFKLHSDLGAVKSTVPSELSWPKNLFVIGTVNIDETTYMFSPKVLDRANVIEFRVQEDEIESFLNAPKDIDFNNLIGNGSTMALDFINMASNGTNGTTSQELNETLVKFFTQLKKTGAEFGYRTAMEIHRLFHQLEVVNSELTTNQKIDIAIMQKLLPKLHGSRRKLCPVLENLGGLCVQEMDAKKEFFENNDDLNFEMDNIRYPLSLEKITRMYKGAIDNGFASYAEA